MSEINILITILLLVSSYLIGSIPGGYLLTKIIKKVDIRNYGSKSTGATNTTRVLGLGLGLVAALFDISKGAIIMLILTLSGLEQYYIYGSINILSLFGLAAIFGHVFPIYLGFKGGKAVATSFGVVIFLTWQIGLIALGLFLILMIISNYVSFSSIVAGLLISIMTFVWWMIDKSFINTEIVITYFFLSITIVLRHKENIKRLIKGEESTVWDRKKKTKAETE